MSTHRTLSLRLVAASLIACGLGTAVIAACSSDDSDHGGQSMNDAAATGDSGGGNGVGADGGQLDSAAPTTDAAVGDAEPTGVPPGCFAGTPMTNEQIMNACTSAQYVVIDNCARIGLCDGGTLPPLVPPPDGGIDGGGTAPADAALDAANDGAPDAE